MGYLIDLWKMEQAHKSDQEGVLEEIEAKLVNGSEARALGCR